MLTHVVLFKLTDRSAENVQATRDRIAAIADKISELRSFEVGVNVIESERAYDIALVATFDSIEGLNAYQTHPAHVEMLSHVRAGFASVVAVDYES